MEKDYDVVLIEKPNCEGLTKTEVIGMYDMLFGTEAFPIEIGDTNGNSSAMGFITPRAAEVLRYDYDQKSKFGQFISSILDDMDKESENGFYLFKELRVHMSR